MGEADDPSALRLSKDSLDRLIVSRLIESPPEDYPQSPLQYLVASYNRASEEMRSKAAASNADVHATAQSCKELIINYAALTLTGGIIPHVGTVVSPCYIHYALADTDIDKRTSELSGFALAGKRAPPAAQRAALTSWYHSAGVL